MRSRAAALGIATALVLAARVHAGSILVDLSESRVLEQSDAKVPFTAGRVPDLLLVEVVRERTAAGALAFADSVPVLAARGDPGPALAGHDRLPVGELLQLLLLVDSRAAARSLAAAVGPGEEAARTRMRRAAARLGLRDTTLPDDWPAAPAPGSHPPRAAAARGQTTASDVARLAITVCADGEVRRRLALDGVPIANGGVIVRATSPLVRLVPPPAPAAGDAGADRREPGPALALASQDGLEVLAVFTGADAARGAWKMVEDALRRYRRVAIVRAGQEIGRSVRVRGGIIPRFSAVAGEPFAMTVRRGSAASVEVRLQLPRMVEAPIDVDQAVGELIVAAEGRIVGAVPLVSPVTIAPRRWLDTAHP